MPDVEERGVRTGLRIGLVVGRVHQSAASRPVHRQHNHKLYFCVLTRILVHRFLLTARPHAHRFHPDPIYRLRVLPETCDGDISFADVARQNCSVVTGNIITSAEDTGMIYLPFLKEVQGYLQA